MLIEKINRTEVCGTTGWIHGRVAVVLRGSRWMLQASSIGAMNVGKCETVWEEEKRWTSPFLSGR